MANTALDIYEGEDKTWIVTIVDSDGVAIDITGYTFLFTVKKDINQSDADALIQKDITVHSDPANGITTIQLDAADTDGYKGTYVFDYQWVDGSGKRRVVIEKSNFIIKQKVGDSFV